MHAAAPRMDALYRSLLVQLREFIARVVAALDAVSDPARRPPCDSIELSFTFSPDITEPAAELSVWIRDQAARGVVPETASDSSIAANAASGKHAIRGVEPALGVSVAAMIIALIVTAPGVVVLVAIVVFLFRRPFIALILGLSSGRRVSKWAVLGLDSLIWRIMAPQPRLGDARPRKRACV